MLYVLGAANIDRNVCCVLWCSSSTVVNRKRTITSSNLSSSQSHLAASRRLAGARREATR